MKRTIQFYRDIVESIQDEHEQLVRAEHGSPRLEYIETYYIANPLQYSRRKIYQIGDLSETEKKHITDHIEFVIFGSIKVSSRTEIIMDTKGRLRKRWITNHRKIKLNLDPATKMMLRELLRDREYG